MHRIFVFLHVHLVVVTSHLKIPEELALGVASARSPWYPRGVSYRVP